MREWRWLLPLFLQRRARMRPDCASRYLRARLPSDSVGQLDASDHLLKQLRDLFLEVADISLLAVAK